VSAAGIPRIFHFIGDRSRPARPFPLLAYLCLESCIQVNRPERVYFHCSHEPSGRYWDLLEDRVTPRWIYPVTRGHQWISFSGTPPPRVRALQTAILRLEPLLEHGGVYADLDTLFVRPLPEHLHRAPFVLGRVSEGGPTGTGWIGSSPRSEFGLAWLDRLDRALEGRGDDSSASPPIDARSHCVHVEPPRSFFRFPPTPEGLSALLERCDPDLDGVYSIHLWHALWAERWRRDLTRFHDGHLTEDYVLTAETTFSIVARRFLPPSPRVASARVPIGNGPTPPGRPPGRFDRWVTRVGERALAAKEELGRQRRVAEARRRAAQFRRFWVSNPFERDNIVMHVVALDEYGIADLRFRPEDVVVDVGAHIGLFAQFCWMLGSRSVHCYEPDEQNFRVLQHNLGSKPGFHLHDAAVWRSDDPVWAPLAISGPNGANTGACSVMAGGRAVDFPAQSIAPPAGSSSQVRTIPLDQILGAFDRVKLLKLDCEGSEFPILLTSQRLDRVDRIVGELHEVGEEMFALAEPRGHVEGCTAYTRDLLVTRLETCGFRVRTRRGSPRMYFFEALRA
jgi:FkbM family methyltransferase